MMPKTLLIFIFLFVLVNASIAQKMQYLKEGRIQYDGETIKNTKMLKEIIDSINSDELRNKFLKYRRAVRWSRSFAVIGGFGLFYSTDGDFITPHIDTKFLMIGVGGSLGSFLLSRTLHRRANDLVDTYNIDYRRW